MLTTSNLECGYINEHERPAGQVTPQASQYTILHDEGNSSNLSAPFTRGVTPAEISKGGQSAQHQAPSKPVVSIEPPMACGIHLHSGLSPKIKGEIELRNRPIDGIPLGHALDKPPFRSEVDDPGRFKTQLSSIGEQNSSLPIPAVRATPFDATGHELCHQWAPTPSPLLERFLSATDDLASERVNTVSSTEIAVEDALTATAQPLKPRTRYPAKPPFTVPESEEDVRTYESCNPGKPSSNLAPDEVDITTHAIHAKPAQHQAANTRDMPPPPPVNMAVRNAMQKGDINPTNDLSPSKLLAPVNALVALPDIEAVTSDGYVISAPNNITELPTAPSAGIPRPPSLKNSGVPFNTKPRFSAHDSNSGSLHAHSGPLPPPIGAVTNLASLASNAPSTVPSPGWTLAPSEWNLSEFGGAGSVYDGFSGRISRSSSFGKAPVLQAGSPIPLRTRYSDHTHPECISGSGTALTPNWSDTDSSNSLIPSPSPLSPSVEGSPLQDTTAPAEEESPPLHVQPGNSTSLRMRFGGGLLACSATDNTQVDRQIDFEAADFKAPHTDARADELGIMGNTDAQHLSPLATVATYTLTSPSRLSYAGSSPKEHLPTIRSNSAARELFYSESEDNPAFISVNSSQAPANQLFSCPSGDHTNPSPSESLRASVETSGMQGMCDVAPTTAAVKAPAWQPCEPVHSSSSKQSSALSSSSSPLPPTASSRFRSVLNMFERKSLRASSSKIFQLRNALHRHMLSCGPNSTPDALPLPDEDTEIARPSPGVPPTPAPTLTTPSRSLSAHTVSDAQVSIATGFPAGPGIRCFGPSSCPPSISSSLTTGTAPASLNQNSSISNHKHSSQSPRTAEPQPPSVASAPSPNHTTALPGVPPDPAPSAGSTTAAWGCRDPQDGHPSVTPGCESIHPPDRPHMSGTESAGSAPTPNSAQPYMQPVQGVEDAPAPMSAAGSSYQPRQPVADATSDGVRQHTGEDAPENASGDTRASSSRSQKLAAEDSETCSSLGLGLGLPGLPTAIVLPESTQESPLAVLGPPMIPQPTPGSEDGLISPWLPNVSRCSNRSSKEAPCTLASVPEATSVPPLAVHPKTDAACADIANAGAHRNAYGVSSPGLPSARTLVHPHSTLSAPDRSAPDGTTTSCLQFDVPQTAGTGRTAGPAASPNTCPDHSPVTGCTGTSANSSWLSGEVSAMCLQVVQEAADASAAAQHFAPPPIDQSSYCEEYVDVWDEAMQGLSAALWEAANTAQLRADRKRRQRSKRSSGALTSSLSLFPECTEGTSASKKSAPVPGLSLPASASRSSGSGGGKCQLLPDLEIIDDGASSAPRPPAQSPTSDVTVMPSPSTGGDDDDDSHGIFVTVPEPLESGLAPQKKGWGIKSRLRKLFRRKKR